MRKRILVAFAIAVAGLTASAEAGAPRRGQGSIQGLTAAAFAASRVPSPGPAQSIGGYAAGCLAGGRALPPEGDGYQAIRLSRNRFYGHPVLIDFIEDLGRELETRGLGVALVADMAQPRGGPMTYAHASHMSGLDVDIWLRLDLPRLDRASRETLEEVNVVDYDRGRVRSGAWSRRQAEMIRAAARDPRVDRIFTHPTIKAALCREDWGDRAWLRKVRPWYGHDGHMHVRLSCPPGSPSCESQKPLPDGDGCEDLGGWIRAADRPIPTIPPSEAKPPRPALPAACRAVLSGRPSPATAVRQR